MVSLMFTTLLNILKKWLEYISVTKFKTEKCFTVSKIYGMKLNKKLETMIMVCTCKYCAHHKTIRLVTSQKMKQMNTKCDTGGISY